MERMPVGVEITKVPVQKRRNIMFKTKVLVLGPCESGKTVLSNFLSDATDTSGGEYHPTVGVRILEFESNNLNVAGKNSSAEVELWDVSGDKKYEGCWPAIARDTSGIIFVYNADVASHERELESWHSAFVQNQGIKENQCIVVAHHKPNSTDKNRVALPSQFLKMPNIHSNIEDEPDNLREEFKKFMANLLTLVSAKREQDELNIMNNR
ncbi:unnamed protein product [Owenia fusiformis]|uniref:Intraflagellar transport protein 22 homolog n=1 Tax=Owenia fusiformis TaxID=6347 RepID=A0A8S4Q317_OWEFU|nr:unnamed protein product [Owenia fusiformis]